MQKKALGKGLDALFHSNPLEADTARGSVTQIPTASIRPNPYQPRGDMDADRLAELADSIRAHGILQPLVVRPHEDGYELVAGERRFRAAQAAGLDEVPVVIRECTNREMLELALIENIQREDINAIDAAVAFRRLIDEFGLTQEDVAARVGKSRPAVANTLRLLNLPPGIRQRVSSGELSEGHARALLGLESAPDAQQALVDRILTQHLNVRETEKLVREITDRKRSPDTPATAPRDPYVTKIEEHLQRYFGTRVSIARNGDRGTIRIDFYDQEQFERILELLTTT